MEEMQNAMWMARSSRERAEFMFGMFATARRALLSSLGKDLTDRQIREQVYFRTYGQHLPDDFFKDDEL